MASAHGISPLIPLERTILVGKKTLQVTTHTLIKFGDGIHPTSSRAIT